MPALNFKKQFAPLVESGVKRQSIRADRKDGRNPHAGETLYLYTGQRTKYCRKLREETCLSVENIAIEPGYRIAVGVRELSVREVNQMTKADGFATFLEFFDFFRAVHGLPFYGKLIKW